MMTGAKLNDPSDDPGEDLLRAALEYDRRLNEDECGREFEQSSPDLARVIRLLQDTLPLPELSDFQQLAGRSDSRGNSLAYGQMLGRFEIREKIGAGAFGVVYRAFDSVMSRFVAVKVPHDDLLATASLVDRFHREMRAAARLSHPYVVRVLEAGLHGNTPYLVSEFVVGRRLSDQLACCGAFDFTSAAGLVMRLAEGVQHAHNLGIVHRDIKPDNILLAEEDTSSSEGILLTPGDEKATGSVIPRLTDFGLARILDDEAGLSRMGAMIGTPRYMAPEQLSGETSCDPRSADIYSLGVVLHELLTGRVPFDRTNTIASHAEICGTAPPSTRRIRSAIPRDLDAICLKCLQPQPRDRYATAQQLADDLDCWLTGRATLARPLTNFEVVSRWVRAHRLMAALASFLASALLVILVMVLAGSRQFAVKNQHLRNANALLTRQQLETLRLKDLAEKERATAVRRGLEYRRLAWTSGIREACSAWENHNLAVADALLERLRQSNEQPEQAIEWQILRQQTRDRFRRLLRLPKPLYEVRGIPGGNTAAVVGEGPQIRIVDIEQGTIIRTIDTGVSALHALAVSHDGAMLAVGGTVDSSTDFSYPLVFETQTGTLLKKLPGQFTTIESLSFSGDSQWLAVGPRYEQISLFHLASEEVRIFNADSRHRWISVGSSGSTLAAVHDNRTIRLTEFGSTRTEAEIQLLYSPLAVLWSDAGTPDHVLADLGDMVGLISTGWPESRPMSRCGFAGSANAGFVRVNDDGDLLFAVLNNGEFVTWPIPAAGSLSAESSQPYSLRREPAEQNQPRTDTSAHVRRIPSQSRWRISEFPVTSLDLHNGWALVTSWGGELIRIRTDDLTDVGSPISTTIHEEFVTAAFDSHGTSLLLATADGILRRQNLPQDPADADGHGGDSIAATPVQTETPPVAEAAAGLKQYPSAPGEVISDIAETADRRSAAWIRNHQDVVVVTADRSRLIRNARKEADPSFPGLFVLAFSPDGRHLAWSGDKFLHVMPDPERTDEVVEVELPGRGNAMVWSRDSNLIFCAGHFTELVKYRVQDGQLVSICDTGTATSALTCSSDGTRLFSGHADGAVRIWTDDGLLINSLHGHRSEVSSIALSADGRIGVSMDIHAGVAIWFAESAERIGNIVEPVMSVDSMDFLIRIPVFAADSRSLHLYYSSSGQQLRCRSFFTAPEVRD